ncbi:MAG: hypothetical protein KIS79_02925 [Burkholderiales bacterium]|nr:hypothetical protein [Burkholderiales bacterium]
MKQSTLALAILAAFAFGSAGVLHAGDRAEDQHTSGASDATSVQEGASNQGAQDDAGQAGTTADQAGSSAGGATGEASSQPEPTDDK